MCDQTRAESDRNLMGLRVKARDIAIFYWQKTLSYSQFFF